jgi:hypothetical protein
MSRATYLPSIGTLASCWFAACVYRLLMLAHAHQLTERDSGQFMVLFPILFVAVGLLVWLVQGHNRLLGLHAIQYGTILLMVAVVLSTVIIYAPHNTIPEPTNETISNAVSSN